MPAHISPTSGIQIMCQPRSIRQKAEKANTHSQKVIRIDEHIKVKNIWATVGHTMLLLDDKKNILQGGWLTDNILFAAEQLLVNSSLLCQVLQDPSLQQSLIFEVQKNKEFMQCLNMGIKGYCVICSMQGRHV